jgi:hypothetical protein
VTVEPLVGRIETARLEGPCVVCPRRIEPGDRIGRMSDGSGYVHEECAPHRVTEAGETLSRDRAHLDTLSSGRVLEKLDNAPDGTRRFRVRVINSGESLNKRFYPEAVLHSAQTRYEGAKVFDHHRSDAEMQTSTVAGLIGTVHTVEAVTGGLDATLHLLATPAAAHAAAVLDASLEGEAANRPALAGLSHDVLMQTRRTTAGVQEATSIDRVLSVDVVADPAAGGRAQRTLAGGEPMLTLRALLDKLSKAKDDDARREILATDEAKAVLKDSELDDAGALRLAAALTPPEPPKPGEKPAAPPEPPKPGEKPAEKDPETGVPDPLHPAKPEDVLVAAEGLIGRAMIREALADLSEPVRKAVLPTIPARFSESSLLAHVKGATEIARAYETAGLVPVVPETKTGAIVVTEDIDQKVAAIDAFFAGDTSGYRSIVEAWKDWTGRRPQFLGQGADVNRQFIRESQAWFDSQEHGVSAVPRPGEKPEELRKRSTEAILAGRSGEALTSGSWAQVLGDSITRRMIADYQFAGLDDWRRIVSSTPSINDFRTQRLDRIGGYGLLPTVLEGAPYQPLTSPDDEEVTYAISKRGGTDEITMEMIANDDMRSVQLIPRRLGRAAAVTLYRFVLDFLDQDPVIYDSVNLFDAAHFNETSTALSTTALDTSRVAMARLAAYGNSTELLGLRPKTLIIVPNLEPLAWQIVTSSVAIPAGSPVGAASNTPNRHQGTGLMVVPYWSSTTKWILVADPNEIPTMEVGFYQGRQTPELFTQSDPNVGSMFDRDVITYKIRHIYGAAILDWRGFTRGNA